MTLETINTPKQATPTVEVKFSASPTGGPFTYVIGGTTFVSDVNVIPINQLITFDTAGLTKFPAGVNPVSYHWDLGDGSEGWGSAITHTYTVANDYQRITLTVTDSTGHKTSTGRQLYLRDLTPMVVRPGIVLTP